MSIHQLPRYHSILSWRLLLIQWKRRNTRQMIIIRKWARTRLDYGNGTRRNTAPIREVKVPRDDHVQCIRISIIYIVWTCMSNTALSQHLISVLCLAALSLVSALPSSHKLSIPPVRHGHVYGCMRQPDKLEFEYMEWELYIVHLFSAVEYTEYEPI